MENNINNTAEESNNMIEEYTNFVAYAYVDGQLVLNQDMVETYGMNEWI